MNNKVLIAVGILITLTQTSMAQQGSLELRLEEEFKKLQEQIEVQIEQNTKEKTETTEVSKIITKQTAKERPVIKEYPENERSSFLLLLLVIVGCLGVMFWFWRKIRLELDDLAYLREETFTSLDSLEDESFIHKYLNRGRQLFRKDNLNAIQQLTTALEHSPTEPQKAEILHYIGLCYLEEFRKTNYLETNHSIYEKRNLKNVEYLLRSEEFLTKAKDLLPHDDNFQLDNDSWLIALFSMKGEHHQALEVAQEALVFARHSNAEIKGKYLEDKIALLQKRIGDEHQSKREKTKTDPAMSSLKGNDYPKELIESKPEYI